MSNDQKVMGNNTDLKFRNKKRRYMYQRQKHTHAHLIIQCINTNLLSSVLLQNNGLLRYTYNHNIFRTLTIIWIQTPDRPPAELVLLSFIARCPFKMVKSHNTFFHLIEMCVSPVAVLLRLLNSGFFFFFYYSLDPSCYVTTNRRERSRPCIMNIF